jgi:hypothetical protein
VNLALSNLLPIYAVCQFQSEMQTKYMATTDGWLSEISGELIWAGRNRESPSCLTARTGQAPGRKVRRWTSSGQVTCDRLRIHSLAT